MNLNENIGGEKLPFPPPEEVTSEFSSDEEAMKIITKKFFNAMANFEINNKGEQVGEDQARDMWLSAMGEYKSEKSNVPKATPGWTGHH